jgi:hypothetical protein
MPPNLIKEFVEKTASLQTPTKLRHWAGVSLVSSLMSRRCHTSILGGENSKKLYGNVYVFLVGEPGTGKSEALDRLRPLLSGSPCARNITLGRSDTTIEGMIKHLSLIYTETIGRAKERSYFTIVSEIATFLRPDDVKQMQTLADLWDCSDSPYEKETVSDGERTVHWQYLSIIANVQPRWLDSVFSSNHMEMGLPSRVLFVWNETKEPMKLFEDEKGLDLTPLYPLMVAISRVKGFIPWELPAQEAFKQWRDEGQWSTGGAPLVGGPAVKHYGTRRAVHIGKLSLIAAVAEHPERPVITLEDFKTGLGWLLDIEPDIVRTLSLVSGNPYRNREEEIVARLRLLKKDRLTEAEVCNELSKAFPTQHMPLVLAGLASRGALIEIPGGRSPFRKFKMGSI